MEIFMKENVPESIYECDEIAFNNGVYIFNWATIWDIIRARCWAKARDDFSKIVWERNIILPDTWNLEVNYNIVSSVTNINANYCYEDFRDLALSSSEDINPLLQLLKQYFIEHVRFRHKFVEKINKATKITHRLIQSSVKTGEFGLKVSKFVAETSADILLIICPFTKIGMVAKGVSLATAGGLKGSIAWSETGDFKLGLTRGGITTAVGLIPFATSKYGAGIIVKLSAGGAGTATGDGVYAHISGGNVTKAAVLGMLKGITVGGARLFSGKVQEELAKEILPKLQKYTIPALVSPTTITNSSSYLWDAAQAKNTKNNTKRTSLKATRNLVDSSYSQDYRDCLTDAVLNAEYYRRISFLEDYAIVDVTQENEGDSTIFEGE